MDDLYFVLYCSDDGDNYLSRHTKASLEKALADQDWGPDIQIHGWSSAHSQINLESHYGLFIFKGSCVVPKPKTVVTEWVV